MRIALSSVGFPVQRVALHVRPSELAPYRVTLERTTNRITHRRGSKALVNSVTFHCGYWEEPFQFPDLPDVRRYGHLAEYRASTSMKHQGAPVPSQRTTQ